MGPVISQFRNETISITSSRKKKGSCHRRQRAAGDGYFIEPTLSPTWIQGAPRQEEVSARLP